MLFVPWRNDTNDTDNIDYMSMYASYSNLVIQNMKLFESRDQSSIDEAIDIFEDLDPDGIVVIEDTNFLIDNRENDNICTVDPNDESRTKPAGGFFNVHNLNTEEEFLQMCRSSNMVQRTIFLHTALL